MFNDIIIEKELLNVMKRFNVNDKVRVKLTVYGIKILKMRHDKLTSDNTNLKNTLGEFKLPEVDSEGYTSFQLWELMNIFGPYMYLGSVESPFDTTIEIDDKYLINKISNKR